MSLLRDINFDTIDGSPNFDVFLNTSHCYNTIIKISNPVRNIKTVKLKGLEMPIQWFNIRNANGSNNFTFNFTYSSFTNVKVVVKITEQTYISIPTLLSTLNTAIATAITAGGYSGLSVVFSLNATSNVVITTNATTLFNVTPTVLINNILGFKTTDVLVSTTVTASNATNLNIDNYLIMNIINLTVAGENSNGRLSTFKIPINAVTGNILFYAENSGYEQTQQCFDKNIILDKLNIQIYDRFGFPVNGNGGDFSFTLGFEYEKNTDSNTFELKTLTLTDECLIDK
jgi:hypothetical protein